MQNKETKPLLELSLKGGDKGGIVVSLSEAEPKVVVTMKQSIVEKKEIKEFP